MGMSNKVRRLTLLSNLTAFSIVLGIVERYLDIVPVPGAKLGLSNLVILAVLYMFSFKEAFIVNITRVFLVGLLSGGFGPTLWIGLSGAIVSVIVMALLKKIGVGIILVSLLGSITHQFGQIFVLIYMLETQAIISYAYIMVPIGVITGIIIGVIAQNFLKHYNSIKEDNNA